MEQVPPTINEFGQDYEEHFKNVEGEQRIAGKRYRKSEKARETFKVRETFTRSSESWNSFFSKLEDFDWVWIGIFALALFVALRNSVSFLYEAIGTEKMYEGFKKMSNGLEKFLAIFGLNLVDCEKCPNAPDTVKEIVRTELPPETNIKSETNVKVNVNTRMAGMLPAGTVGYLTNPATYAVLLGMFSMSRFNRMLESAILFMDKYLDIFLRFIFQL